MRWKLDDYPISDACDYIPDSDVTVRYNTIPEDERLRIILTENSLPSFGFARPCFPITVSYNCHPFLFSLIQHFVIWSFLQ